MKKLFFLSAMIGLMASTATAIEIYSCNTVGVQRVTGTLTDSKLTAPMPFVGIGGGVANLKDSVYSDNTMLNTFQLCLDSSSGYYSQWLSLTGIGDGGMVSVPRVIDGEEISPSEANVQALPIGAGLMVDRTSVSQPVFIMGQYTDAAPTTTIQGKTRSYLCSPLNQDFSLEEKLTDSQGVSEDDVVYINDGVQEHEYRYSIEGEGGKHWYEIKQQHVITTNRKTGAQEAGFKDVRDYGSAIIPAGNGFIYKREVDSVLTFAW